MARSSVNDSAAIISAAGSQTRAPRLSMKLRQHRSVNRPENYSSLDQEQVVRAFTSTLRGLTTDTFSGHTLMGSNSILRRKVVSYTP